MTAADLAQYTAEWVEPISTTYRGWTVYELPPNGQGIAALEMLNIMERFPLGEMGHNSVRALHTMIEAKKLAYADMIRFDADPKFAKIPVAGLGSKEFAADAREAHRCRQGELRRPAGTPPATDHGTTYLSVVDSEGNMVSLIQSNYSSVGFGSGLAVGGAGFALQNRGGLFTLDATHPNVLAGRKRPVHTIIPAFMQQGRCPHRVRHHGRMESGAGPRAIRVERRRLRHERPGGARCAAVLEGDVCRLRREPRIADSRRDAQGAHRDGPPDRDARRLFVDADGSGSGGRSATSQAREFRRVRPAQGRRRRGRAHARAVKAGVGLEL